MQQAVHTIMLRLTNVKLPLDHSSSALKQEVIRKLELQEGELLDFTVFKRSLRTSVVWHSLLATIRLGPVLT